MADQIPRFKNKRRVLQFIPPHLFFQTLMVGLCVLARSICSVQAAICPPSVSSSVATTTEQYNFSGRTNTLEVAGNSVSNNLYYMYSIFLESERAAVRKVDASGSQIWLASFLFEPIKKSLSVDAAEQSVYLASMTNHLTVLKLSASDGSIISQQKL